MYVLHRFCKHFIGKRYHMKEETNSRLIKPLFSKPEPAPFDHVIID